MNTFLKLKCNYNGFTLIEIAAVLVIIAILSTLAVRHMGSSGISVYGDADRLVADLRYAQSLAMTRSQNITVEIKSNSWEISDLSFADGETARTEQGVTFPPGSRISITFKYPKGSVDLGSDQTITLQRGDNSIAVKVYDETGYVEIL
jgi:prepilin-type N-terminal cleavage/methylation domain-containing protein